MRHRLFSAAISLCAIAFFTVATAPSLSAATVAPVAITSTFTSCTADFSVCTGTFVASGGLATSGTVTMHTFFYANGKLAHCLYLFESKDGTFTVVEDCEFITDPAHGIWRIVSGTGAYRHLRGIGSALMPDNLEIWTGVVF
jgi:hypothetical protein